MTANARRKLKKALWYLGAIGLMPVGLAVGVLTKIDELGGNLFLLGLILTVLLTYLDGNNEFYPDREWKVDHQTGRRYRIIGAGRNMTIEYHVEDILNSLEYRQHIEQLRRLEAEGKIGPLHPPIELGGVER